MLLRIRCVSTLLGVVVRFFLKPDFKLFKDYYGGSNFSRLLFFPHSSLSYITFGTRTTGLNRFLNVIFIQLIYFIRTRYHGSESNAQKTGQGARLK